MKNEKEDLSEWKVRVRQVLNKTYLGNCLENNELKLSYLAENRNVTKKSPP